MRSVPRSLSTRDDPGGERLSDNRSRRRGPVLALFFVMGAELFLVPPMLPELEQRFGVGVGAGAAMVIAYVIAYAVCTPICGALGDRYSRASVIALGAAVYATGILGCALAPAYGVLLVAHAVAGIGGALVSPAVWAHLAESSPPARRGRAVAAGAAAYNGGQIVGVPLGAITAAAIGWRWAFLVVAIAGAGCAGWVRVAVRGIGGARAVDARTRLRQSFGLWNRREFAVTVAATTLSQAARLGAYTSVSALFGTRFGLSLIALGLLGGVAGLGSLLGALGAGPSVDRWRSRGGSPATLCIAWGALLAGALVVSLTARSLVVAAVALVVWFAAGGACYSTGQAILALAVPQNRAAAVSWNNAAMNVGVAIGSAALGATVAGGPTFVTVAATLAVASAAVSAMNRRR